MNYYSYEKVNDRITAIRSMSGEIMYLIVGEKQAVLIDTCIGIGSLKNIVGEITDKPLTVLISHGHIDHAMGAPEFACAYMNHLDIPLYQSMCDIAGRRGYAQMGMGPDAENLSDEAFIPETPDYQFQNLQEGMTFDLGGVHVDCYAYPGHTKGCMVFVVREEKILILGDACNNSTFLFSKGIASSVAEYKDTTKRVADKLRGTYDRVLLMHHVMDAPVSILGEMIELCDEIIEGKTDNIPTEFMGERACIAKACNEFRQRNDGKFANLLFDPENIN